MKLFIESECFIQVLFYSIWHGSLGNNKMKLSAETSLMEYSFKDTHKSSVHLFFKKKIETHLVNHASWDGGANANAEPCYILYAPGFNLQA
jgi:hypothetical protein